MKLHHKMAAFLLILGAVLALPSIALAATWDGGAGDNNFLTGTNWSGNVFPSGYEIADLTQTGYRISANLNGIAPNNVIELYVARNAGSGCSTLNIGETSELEAGTLTVGAALKIGDVAGDYGAINQSGGTLQWNGASMGSACQIGANAGSYGFYNLQDGTFNANGSTPVYIGYNGCGILQQSGGTFSRTGTIQVGFGSTGNGLLNIQGGTFTQSGAMTIGPNALFGKAVVNVGCENGGGQLTANSGITLGSSTFNSAGIINLTGDDNAAGVLTTSSIATGSNGTGLLNFHGGTLKPTANTTLASPFVKAGVNTCVYSEGGTIDTAGFNTVISSGLMSPVGMGVRSIALTDGGSNYIGPLFVQITGGSGSGATAYVHMNGSGSVQDFVISNPGSGYHVDDVLTATFYGTAGGSGAAAGTVTLTDDIVRFGTLTKKGAGKLTLTGAGTFSGTLDIQAGAVALNGGQLGSLAIIDNDASFSIEDTAPHTFRAITGLGSTQVLAGGQLTVGSICQGTLAIGSTGGSMAAAAVPEPSTLILLALAGAAALLCTIKRK